MDDRDDMIKDAVGMAKAALHLLHLSSQMKEVVTLQIAAAVLAAHVCDWHFRPKDPGPSEKDLFAADYPGWRAVLAVANGAKHPKLKYPQIDSANLRVPEWEDVDFWNSNLDSESMFIDVGGRERSLSAVIFEFCSNYIEKNK